MNGIVHPCSHPEDRPAPETVEDMMLAIYEYTDRVVNMVRPRKILMIAVDGVAPRAKMNQQRQRRFRAAKEAKEKDDDKAALLVLLKQQHGGVLPEGTEETMTKKTWDSNSITPGTPFMQVLSAALRYWCQLKLNQDPAWANLKVIISDASVPGEGEHKIMEFVRSQRSSPEHDPNTRHVMYGLDADLIMLGLATHEPRFHVLREDVFFNDTKAGHCKLCNQKGHYADQCKGEVKKKEGEFDEKEGGLPKKPFIWLHVSVLREYLQEEMQVPNQPFPFDLERALDDWVFMCFFVGNDFLPHLPALEIREDGIDTLIAIWRDNMPTMGGYLTKDGDVNLERAQLILNGLAKQEDAIFRRRRQTEEKKANNAKRRKIEQERNNSNGNGKTYNRREQISKEDQAAMPLFDLSARDGPEHITHAMVVNRSAATNMTSANKSAAAVLKAQLKNGNGSEGNGTDGEANGDVESPAGIKRKAELISADDGLPTTPGRSSPPQPAPKPKDDDELPPDSVRLWEDGYADRYYEQKFGADPSDMAFRNKVAASYVEGLAWVLRYYFQGCASWDWYYPYHYAPFAADFVDLKDQVINFDKGTIFRPYEQLMGVMPAASRHTLPEPFHDLMTEPNSDVIDFYPDDFPIDLNGKKFAWQGVALLPFIDEKRLLAAMATRYPELTAEQHKLNGIGNDVLLFSDKHEMFTDVSNQLFSKKQAEAKHTLNPRVTGGLAGKVEKNPDFIPQSILTFPFESGEMPDLDEDHSISVHYEMPKSGNVHKSMLLRGAKPDPPALNSNDIRETRERASRSGRQYGGAPLHRNDSGRGRGRGRGGYGGGGGRNGDINYGSDRRDNGQYNQYNQYPPQAPGYGPPPPGYGGYPPPPPQMGGFGQGPPPPPPGRGYGGPPPPHYQGGGYAGPPPPNGYGRGPPPPPQHYRNQGPAPGNSNYRGNGGGRDDYRNGRDNYRNDNRNGGRY